MPIPTRKELDARKQEINIMYSKVSEVESALKEEKKVNMRLRGDLSTKVQQLTNIEKSIVEEQESYRWTKNDDTTKIQVISTEGDRRIEELDNIESDMSIEMAEHDFFQAENERLHQKLKRLAVEHYHASTQQKEEREQRKQASFEMRATMEQILRRTLKEVDREYMLKVRVPCAGPLVFWPVVSLLLLYFIVAFLLSCTLVPVFSSISTFLPHSPPTPCFSPSQANDKMDSEANWARLENIKLKKEAIKRQENCASLVRQQQESYEELVRVKVAKDVLEEASQKQEESRVVAASNLLVIRENNERLEEHVLELEGDIATLLAQVEHKRALKKELGGLRVRLAKAEGERRSIQRNVVLTCRKSVARGLVIASQNRKREGKKLTQGFQAMGGETDAGDNDASAEAVAEQEDDEDTRSHVTASTTFLNNEDAVLLMAEREEKEQEEADAVWKSTKSDVHVATRLRMEIRRMRKRELREKMRKEAEERVQLTSALTSAVVPAQPPGAQSQKPRQQSVTQ